MKQDTQINWDGYMKEHSAQAVFSFLGGDRIATLIEQHLLDEHIFSREDRTHLRKSLALAGELDYDQRDLHRLFHRQLGLMDGGALSEASVKPIDLVKALRIVNLAAQVFSRWSEDEGNLKQALVATERTMLWSWHRIHLDQSENKERYYTEFAESWRGYNAIAHQYFGKLHDHYYVQDVLSGYSQENAEFSLIVFEQIGLVASIGLCQALAATDEETTQGHPGNAVAVADALTALLRNNPVSGSPRLDEHVIDITLGLLLEAARRPPPARIAHSESPLATGQVLPTRVVLPKSGLELLQGLGEIGPAPLTTLCLGAFGLNPIGTIQISTRAHAPS